MGTIFWEEIFVFQYTVYNFLFLGSELMDFLKMSDITKNNRAAVFSWWHSFIGHYFSMEKHFFLKIASRCLFLKKNGKWHFYDRKRGNRKRLWMIKSTRKYFQKKKLSGQSYFFLSLKRWLYHSSKIIGCLTRF